MSVVDSEACVLGAEDGSFHVGVHDGVEDGVFSGAVRVEEAISCSEVGMLGIEVL